MDREGKSYSEILIEKLSSEFASTTKVFPDAEYRSLVRTQDNNIKTFQNLLGQAQTIMDEINQRLKRTTVDREENKPTKSEVSVQLPESSVSDKLTAVTKVGLQTLVADVGVQVSVEQRHEATHAAEAISDFTVDTKISVSMKEHEREITEQKTCKDKDEPSITSNEPNTFKSEHLKPLCCMCKSDEINITPTTSHRTGVGTCLYTCSKCLEKVVSTMLMTASAEESNIETVTTKEKEAQSLSNDQTVGDDVASVHSATISSIEEEKAEDVQPSIKSIEIKSSVDVNANTNIQCSGIDVSTKNKLSIQMMPPIAIRRGLTAQKIPAVVITSSESVPQLDVAEHANVAYEVVKHKIESKAAIKDEGNKIDGQDLVVNVTVSNMKQQERDIQADITISSGSSKISKVLSDSTSGSKVTKIKNSRRSTEKQIDDESEINPSLAFPASDLRSNGYNERKNACAVVRSDLLNKISAHDFRCETVSEDVSSSLSTIPEMQQCSCSNSENGQIEPKQQCAAIRGDILLELLMCTAKLGYEKVKQLISLFSEDMLISLLMHLLHSTSSPVHEMGKIKKEKLFSSIGEDVISQLLVHVAKMKSSSEVVQKDEPVNSQSEKGVLKFDNVTNRVKENQALQQQTFEMTQNVSICSNSESNKKEIIFNTAVSTTLMKSSDANETSAGNKASSVREEILEHLSFPATKCKQNENDHRKVIEDILNTIMPTLLSKHASVNKCTTKCQLDKLELNEDTLLNTNTNLKQTLPDSPTTTFLNSSFKSKTESEQLVASNKSPSFSIDGGTIGRISNIADCLSQSSTENVREYLNEMIKNPETAVLFKSFQILQDRTDHFPQEHIDDEKLSFIDEDVYKTFVNPRGLNYKSPIKLNSIVSIGSRSKSEKPSNKLNVENLMEETVHVDECPPSFYSTKAVQCGETNSGEKVEIQSSSMSNYSQTVSGKSKTPKINISTNTSNADTFQAPLVQETFSSVKKPYSIASSRRSTVLSRSSGGQFLSQTSKTSSEKGTCKKSSQSASSSLLSEALFGNTNKPQSAVSQNTEDLILQIDSPTVRKSVEASRSNADRVNKSMRRNFIDTMLFQEKILEDMDRSSIPPKDVMSCSESEYVIIHDVSLQTSLRDASENQIDTARDSENISRTSCCPILRRSPKKKKPEDAYEKSEFQSNKENSSVLSSPSVQWEKEKDEEPFDTLSTPAEIVPSEEPDKYNKDDNLLDKTPNISVLKVPEEEQKNRTGSGESANGVKVESPKRATIDSGTEQLPNTEVQNMTENVSCQKSLKSTSDDVSPEHDTTNRYRRKRKYKQTKKGSRAITSPESTITESSSGKAREMLSEGEVKCSCSASIGQVHVCSRIQSSIPVQYLKRHPQRLMRHELGDPDAKIKGQKEYYSNWVSYYVSKSPSPELDVSQAESSGDSSGLVRK